ncbi:MAG TPA: hypothetical protein VFR70_06935 [Flavobacterium sp.]|nr:hypothetical protein [Flavobacterium sp.]
MLMIFMKEKVRISTLESCRNLENELARDEQEGITVVGAEIKPETEKDRKSAPPDLDGIIAGTEGIPLVHIGNSTLKLENAYVLCLTTAYSSYMKDVFGPYGIEISRPGAFFYLVHSLMKELMLVQDAMPGPIIYDDGLLLDPAQETTAKAAGFYKESRFASEKEYRLRLLATEAAIEPVVIEIANMREICRKLY